ncbi:MAG: hypothetical protein EOP51_20380, partial [Sphingobacteriales bacterium]
MSRIFIHCILFFLSLSVFSEVSAQTTIQIGTGTASTGTTTPSPVNIYFRNTHHQILYLKSEINAQGINGPQIFDEIQFNVTGVPIYAIPNYTVKITHYASNNLTTNYTGPFTTVYNNVSLTPTTGWNAFAFTAPFIWNGNDNILIELCWDLVNPTWNSSGTVQYTPASSKHLYYWSDVTPACTQPASSDNSSNRPNIKMRFTPLPACAGAPTTGTASIVSNCPTTVGLTGYTIASNITFQWQVKGSCDTVWSDIAGATSASYSINSQTSPKEYRAIIVCTNSGQADTSNVILINSVAPCYPAPGNPTSTFYHDIINVNVGSLTNASTCGTTGGPGSMQNMYSNYSGVVPAVDLPKGVPIPYSITVTDNCGGTFTAGYGTAIFIDHNYNGSFEVSERVAANAATVTGAHTVSGTFTLPTTSMGTGPTGMRIIHAYNIAGTSIDANSSFSYGEVEDYQVNLLYTPGATGGGTFCSGQNVTLSATAPGITNPVFIWINPAGQVFDTAATTTINNIQVSQGGIYTVRVLTYPCGAAGVPDTSGPREVTVAVNQTPTAPIVSPMIVYCQNDPFDSIAVFGQGLSWYSIPQGGVGSPNPPVVNTSVFGSVTYYVSQSALGCEGPRAPVTISVVPKPAPPQVVTPVVYCQGDTPAPLFASGQNVRWYSIPTGGVGTSITPTPGTNAQGTFTWYVSQTVAGCESQRIPVEVRVNYVPNAL